MNNNTGIAAIYVAIKNIFGVNPVSLPLVALIVNILIIYLSLLSFCKVVDLLGLHPNYYLLFFMNGSLLYFSQLINKDSLTLLIFIKSLELILGDRKKAFFWLIPVSFIIRIQLVPFLLLTLFLSGENKPILRFWLAYIFTAIIAGLVMKYIPLLSMETMTSGLGLNLNLIVMQLNQKYALGSLFLNPLRVIQYLLSLYHSLSFTNLYWVDVGKIKDLPQIFVLLTSMPFLIKCYFRYSRYIELPSRILMAQVSAFFMVWLINPTTSGRYLLVLIPTISLLAVYVYTTNFKDAKFN
ncbi:hypothetical protein BZJ21_14320 [Salinivibrio costicola subsp. alcaliphilus]|uniref:Oligosaccharide repeat unit polymerase n=1 Tax=Salinivibrio costicola subsp. alcaliphilus TaxID=272773 RepID=A0ABX3KP16_SALCS|nr:hypothetical protein BZJ21_14320 [Salinivibrio costicola subsp. alcaliphilus]